MDFDDDMIVIQEIKNISMRLVQNEMMYQLYKIEKEKELSNMYLIMRKGMAGKGINYIRQQNSF